MCIVRHNLSSIIMLLFMCLQARQYKFDLKPPRGYGLGTIFKKPRPNTSNQSEQDLEAGQQDTLSASPPPSPLDRENGQGDVKRRSSAQSIKSGKHYSSTASLPTADSPVRPPKPKSSSSTANLHATPPPVTGYVNSPTLAGILPQLPRPGPKPLDRKPPALPPDSEGVRKEEKFGKRLPPPPPGSSPINHEHYRPPPPVPNNDVSLPPAIPNSEPPRQAPAYPPKPNLANEESPPPCPPRILDNDVRPPPQPPRSRPSNNVLPLPDKPDKNKLPLPPRPKKLDNSAPPIPPRK